jgi:hypothetical protein
VIINFSDGRAPLGQILNGLLSLPAVAGERFGSLDLPLSFPEVMSQAAHRTAKEVGSGGKKVTKNLFNMRSSTASTPYFCSWERGRKT